MVEQTQAGHGALLEAAPVAIIGVRPDGTITVVNAQTERLFGYSRGELLGQSIEILVPESVRHLQPGGRGRYVADPKPRPTGEGMELSGRRKDGSEFLAGISLSTIDTAEGVLFATAIRDITEQKQAVEAQARLASIVQASHDAIIGENLDGVITSWNPGAERLYGYPAAQALGRRFDILIPDDRRGEEAAMMRRILGGHRIDPGQTERLRKDGSHVTVSMAVSAISDPAGRMVGIARVSRDLTELQRAEAMSRGLLEAAPDAVLGVDGDGRILLANAQVERLFGYQRDELIGQPVEILVPEAVRNLHPHHRSGYFADPRPRPMGARLQLAARRKDGSEFPAEISLSPFQTGDGIIVSAAVRDVTERLEAQAERDSLLALAERERLEGQLHQSQRLESLGQLAGGVAHDFNNLLGAVLIYTSFVAEEVERAAIAEPRWQAVQRDVDQIGRAAQRATQLTHQLLAFGRREVVQPRVLDLNEVVADVEQLLRRTIGEHLELAIRLAPDLWPVMADPGQLEQVLVNLAVNARDAMLGGGTLTIDTHNEIVDGTHAAERGGLVPGRHVRLRVSDTGSGMDAAVLERAFEPFFTTKPKGEGSGLGLATVYGIITQAGGHVYIYSEAGIGTTISVMLPTTDSVATAGEPAAPVHRSAGGETVLVVEDEEAMREVARRILSRNGYQVICARNGAEAMEIARDHEWPIHLLVTDVVMPKMQGKEVAERVSAMRPGIRVLYMSGYAQPILASRGTLDAGVTLVEKPFSEAGFLKKVREVLDSDGRSATAL